MHHCNNAGNNVHSSTGCLSIHHCKDTDHSMFGFNFSVCDLCLTSSLETSARMPESVRLKFATELLNQQRSQDELCCGGPTDTCLVTAHSFFQSLEEEKKITHCNDSNLNRFLEWCAGSRL